MNQHQYETKFIVRSYYGHGDFGNTADLIGARVVPVYHLIELKVNVNEKINQHVKKSGTQILVIEPNKRKNIALTYVSDNNLTELLKLGAELIDKQFVFNDKIDAKIQMAFVCAKHMIEQKDVYRATEGQLTPEGYGQLVEVFYKDFPEKFI